jgi:hypothetical protein
MPVNLVVVPSIKGNEQKDLSSFPSDIVGFVDICFPDLLFDVLNNDFVPTLDDVDVIMFVQESLLLPVLDNNKPCLAGRFGTITDAKLEVEEGWY